MDLSLQTLLEKAAENRSGLLDEHHLAAFRLFNGFTEGLPGLAVDLYAASLVIHNLSDPPAGLEEAVQAALEFYSARLPWLQTVVLKTRHADTLEAKCGCLLLGTIPSDRVREHGVWYALDLLMQQDASLYLDTRNLRRWAIQNLKGKIVLNTFAYTGSLGVAALGGGAHRVVQLDRNQAYLNLAKTSCALNGFPIHKPDYLVGDFWTLVSRLKRNGGQFDCVFLDPPFFAASGKGTVDLQKNSQRLINKLRPLVKDGGWLVAINNALFVSGRDYLASLEELCADGYVHIEDILPVPDDFCGYPHTRLADPAVTTAPVDPSPFNHPTKIAILRVKRK
ncbi:MAG: SAM-dependent methyltransferase [Chloroflexi bacterium GWB2_49_20]|nr:MAG: SAM-dependent methyltransferase [Chloroflexi bacterium GWB2_49_20]OGN77467.1 MAG: SAM-dependent methyltransferase [Chloroflexi bacterium GWC2_49_37]OGN84829.1 MAG: SAM-dependent methyltransferase [Chloroflexi bacterium GWD2_49_16]HCC79248.1 SAM-dependent methyltransferase [Anaerolineae bacterium]